MAPRIAQVTPKCPQFKFSALALGTLGRFKNATATQPRFPTDLGSILTAIFGHMLMILLPFWCYFDAYWNKVFIYFRHSLKQNLPLGAASSSQLQPIPLLPTASPEIRLQVSQKSRKNHRPNKPLRDILSTRYFFDRTCFKEVSPGVGRRP